MAVDITTYKNIPPQTSGGYVFFVKDIQYNKCFQCGEDCLTYSLIKDSVNRTCEHCINPHVRGSFKCTEVVLGVVATSSVVKEWYVYNKIDIITTKGNTYSGMVLCGNVLDNRLRTNLYKPIHQRTKAIIVYTFNVLSEGEEIQKVLLTDYFNTSKYLTFNIIESNSEEDEYIIDNYIPSPRLSSIKDNTLFSTDSQRVGVHDIYVIRRLADRINTLKTDIFQRFNSRITHSDAEKLEDKIETDIYSLSLSFSDKNHISTDEWKSLKEDYDEVVANYREVLFQKKQAERGDEIKLKKTSELLNINPYDFEVLCSDIMRVVGYENVVVTPRSNDKGIDIIAEINGERVVAQCKRYKDSVGSPDMQMFIGAMRNAKATGGVYFTTGYFSKEAEQMAAANNLVLYDRKRLAKVLSLVDDIIPQRRVQTEHPTLWEDTDDLPE